MDSKVYRKTRRFCSVECQYASKNKYQSCFAWDKADNESKKAKTLQNFYRNLIIKDGCWDYKTGKQYIYPSVEIDKRKTTTIHRLSWELHNGPIPEGMVVRHLCGNPRCCRPSHLAIGTQKENYEDSREIETNCQGSLHGNSKINEQQVVEIKKLISSEGLKFQEIADMFGVTKHVIKDISRGKTWRHVSWPE